MGKYIKPDSWENVLLPSDYPYSRWPRENNWLWHNRKMDFALKRKVDLAVQNSTVVRDTRNIIKSEKYKKANSSERSDMLFELWMRK